ncbi:hypothetical protein BASA61_008751 [Batrachochytrium salamandrivorans]|nr:hypothetical protein BASA62_001641 [Batrachochytrium salamandrivorans]KAH6582004.1 hypothetical protein BASA61_008751 [Batrachochytrium salamandrivorans]KAH9275455.1 hypothetical protein BASA83_002229 [Batrachochytrium salamandrivorans]
MTEVTEAPTTRVMEVLYCGNCGAPPEYCEFGTTLVECKAWLRTADNDLSVHLYGAEVPVEEVQDQVASLDIAAQGDGSTATAAPTKSSKKNAAANSSVKKVVLTTIERTKRKRITVVSGLEKFDVDLKKAAKQMASKFACGTSVTKNSQDMACN